MDPKSPENYAKNGTKKGANLIRPQDGSGPPDPGQERHKHKNTYSHMCKKDQCQTSKKPKGFVGIHI